MQKKFIILPFIMFFLFTLSASAETGKSGFVFFPMTDSSFKPHFTVALMGSSISPTSSDATQTSSSSASGVEISLDCPWFQLGKNPLRQQISIQTYANELENLTSVEFNPHYYLVNIDKKYLVGFGPGFGWLQSSATNSITNETTSNTFFTVQYGLSVDINLGNIHLGLESRELISQVKAGKYLENSRNALKLGFNF